MAKLVILTVPLDEAEAAKAFLERLQVPVMPSQTVKLTLSFNAKLHKAIQHTKGVKQRV